MSYNNKSAWDSFMDGVFDGIIQRVKEDKELQNNLNSLKDAAWDGAKQGFKKALGINDEREKNDNVK